MLRKSLFECNKQTCNEDLVFDCAAQVFQKTLLSQLLGLARGRSTGVLNQALDQALGLDGRLGFQHLDKGLNVVSELGHAKGVVQHIVGHCRVHARVELAADRGRNPLEDKLELQVATKGAAAPVARGDRSRDHRGACDFTAAFRVWHESPFRGVDGRGSKACNRFVDFAQDQGLVELADPGHFGFEGLSVNGTNLSLTTTELIPNRIE